MITVQLQCLEAIRNGVLVLQETLLIVFFHHKGLKALEIEKRLLKNFQTGDMS